MDRKNEKAAEEIGDVQAIGAHCDVNTCHRLDFLPFKCESCKGYACPSPFLPRTYAASPSSAVAASSPCALPELQLTISPSTGHTVSTTARKPLIPVPKLVPGSRTVLPPLPDLQPLIPPTPNPSSPQHAPSPNAKPSSTRPGNPVSTALFVENSTA